MLWNDVLCGKLESDVSATEGKIAPAWCATNIRTIENLLSVFVTGNV